MENFTIKQKVTGLEKSAYRERVSTNVKRLRKGMKNLKNPQFGFTFFNYKVNF